jgi:uncharacterized surface protein with fasciclin (FAS1) repeats
LPYIFYEKRWCFFEEQHYQERTHFTLMKLQITPRSRCCALALGTLTLAATPQAKADDIGTTAIKAGNFKTLVKAAKAAGLAPTIMGDTKLTVFAPTDAAFAKLPKGTLDKLMKPENKATLKKILSYHVVAGTVPAKKILAMPATSSVKTVEGESVTVKHMGKKVMVNIATVTKADVMADNGVIHVIDSVLIPPTVAKMLAAKPKM